MRHKVCAAPEPHFSGDTIGGGGFRSTNVAEVIMSKQETFEGYLIDQACLRKYPQDELLERARSHTKKCALMGHCVESGYGLVGAEGRPFLLEPASTLEVVAAIRRSERDQGIRLRATREMQDEEMRTTRIEEV